MTLPHPQKSHSNRAVPRRPGLPPEGVRASLAVMAAGITLTACVGSCAPVSVNAGPPVSSAPAELASPELASPELVAEELEALPKKSWREAARTGDWPGVAQGIDALPLEQRSEPGTRYVRAHAAAQMGDCGLALVALEGLAEQLPALTEEVAKLTARCQLEVGPFDAAAAYYAEQNSAAALLAAARGWKRAGQLERAHQLLDRALVSAGKKRSQRDTAVAARELRAEIAEQLGQRELARDDRRWLALVAVTPGADEAYEKLVGAKLSKAERWRRARALAKRGQATRVERELRLLEAAAGTAPSEAELVRTLAEAHYNSRIDCRTGAKLFERAARLSRKGRLRNLFSAAQAWARAGDSQRAIPVYEQVARDYPGTSYAERAQYSVASLHYRQGHWDEAERAYTSYLRRRPSRYISKSRYERAVAQLAAGRSAPALDALQRLRRRAPRGARRALLEHLEAVALASSGVAAQQEQAVEQFEAVIQQYPLSFAALASAARLEGLGRLAPPFLPPPPEPDSALGAAVELPEKARLLVDLGLYTAAERTLYSHERALRRELAPRAGASLCRLYESLDRGWRRYAVGAMSVKNDTLRRAPTASNLWAWQCLYPTPFGDTVAELEARYQLPAGLVHSVMRQESAFRPDVRSPAGAIGLMQLMPSTARLAAGELSWEHERDRLTQPRYNLELGAYYLGKLLETFDRHVVPAVASYNAGPVAVSGWLKGGQDLSLDLWVARIPYTETRNYVMRVMSNWARYRYLEGGPERISRLVLDLPAEVELATNSY